MKKIKLGLWNITIPEKIQKVRTIVTKMTGNTNFTTPLPSLTAVTAAVNKLELSYENALDGGKTKKAIMRADSLALDTIMSQLGAYVQDITLGDELKILSSGIEIQSKPSLPTILEAPLNAISTGSSVEGQANLKWKRIKNAKAYIIQTTATPTNEATWKFLDTTTRSKLNATNLVSLAINWFRVAAIGSKGQGAWSDPFKASVL